MIVINSRNRVFYDKFIVNHPEFKDFIVRAEKTRNSFLISLASQLAQYGNLSVKQQAVAGSVLVQVEANVGAGPAPTGNVLVDCTILSIKNYANNFGKKGGVTTKMLCRVDNGAKVFCAVPAALLAILANFPTAIGARVRVSAMWTPKADDKTFAFGKKPAGMLITPPTPNTPAPPVELPQAEKYAEHDDFDTQVQADELVPDTCEIILD